MMNRYKIFSPLSWKIRFWLSRSWVFPVSLMVDQLYIKDNHHHINNKILKDAFDDIFEGDRFGSIT